MPDIDRNSELYQECVEAFGFRLDADAAYLIATRHRDEAIACYRADAERLDSFARFLRGKAGVTIEIADLGMGPARVIEVWKDNADGVTLDHVGDFQEPRQAIDAARAAEGTK